METFEFEKVQGNEGREERMLREKFEEQFLNFEEIPLGEGAFEAIDLTPEEIKDEVPVLFVCGYAKTPRTYKEALFEAYKSGRRVLCSTAPATLTGIEATDKYTVGQNERAHALLELLKVKGVEKVDVITHSEGGINATIAAEVEPEKFRHFVFVAIPGVTDEQSLFEIAKRGIQNIGQGKFEHFRSSGVIKERYSQSFSDMKNWTKVRKKEMGSPTKTLLESMDPGRIDISEEVRRLHESGHGISIISGVEDKILPMKEYQRTKEGEKRSAAELGVDGFYPVKKGHAELEVNEDMGAAAVLALKALKAKYDRKAGERIVD